MIAIGLIVFAAGLVLIWAGVTNPPGGVIGAAQQLLGAKK